MNEIKFYYNWLWAWFLKVRVGNRYHYRCPFKDTPLIGTITRLRARANASFKDTPLNGTIDRLDFAPGVDNGNLMVHVTFDEDKSNHIRCGIYYLGTFLDEFEPVESDDSRDIL